MTQIAQIKYRTFEISSAPICVICGKMGGWTEIRNPKSEIRILGKGQPRYSLPRRMQ